MGVRVPMTVVSPFSVGGWVCSDVFDHTSQLRFLETVFGVEAPNISAWRRATTGDLTSTLPVLTAPVTKVQTLPLTSDSTTAPPGRRRVHGRGDHRGQPEQSSTAPFPVKKHQKMPKQSEGSAQAHTVLIWPSSAT